MRLPDGSGLDLLAYLEDNGRREKAIVITAYGSAENAVEALKAGAYDYLTKPVDLKQFRAVVASALGRGPAIAPSTLPSSLPAQRATAAVVSTPDAAAPSVPGELPVGAATSASRAAAQAAAQAVTTAAGASSVALNRMAVSRLRCSRCARWSTRWRAAWRRCW